MIKKQKSYDIGTLLAKNDPYDSWLRDSDTRVLGIIIDIKQMKYDMNFENYEHHYVIRWENEEKLDYLDTKVLKAHIKSGFIKVVSEG
jgi:hypothetical protein